MFPSVIIRICRKLNKFYLKSDFKQKTIKSKIKIVKEKIFQMKMSCGGSGYKMFNNYSYYSFIHLQYHEVIFQLLLSSTIHDALISTGILTQCFYHPYRIQFRRSSRKHKTDKNEKHKLLLKYLM